MKIFEKNDNFDELIKEGLTLVDFYAEWCGPCKMMGPVLESLNNVNVIKVNVDEQQALASQFGIMSIPTIAVMKDGKVIDSAFGALPKEDLEKLCDIK